MIRKVLIMSLFVCGLLAAVGCDEDPITLDASTGSGSGSTGSGTGDSDGDTDGGDSN